MNSKTLLKTLFVLSLSSCASIKVPDIEVCADISQSQGYCVKTLSASESVKEGSQWKEFNSRALKMSPESYGELKAVLLKLCKKSKDCNLEETEAKIMQIEQLINSNAVSM